MKFKILILLLILGLATTPLFAQKQWTLQECIQYAVEHNPDLTQGILNERIAQLQYNQNRLSQIPNLSGGLNYGKSYGRSIDPTSNQFINTNYTFSGLNGNLDVLLFGWFSKRNAIAADKLSLQSSQADYDQLKDDIRLNVATGFLRVLLAKEQVRISEKQVQFSEAQRNQTEKFVQAGRSPQLDLVQLQAQVASDSAAYFSTVNDYQQSIIQLKALMNLDMADDFEPESPQIEEIPLNVLTQYSPEQIYEVAKDEMGSIRSSDLQIASAEKQLKAQKALLYPQLSFGLQLATNYASTVKDFVHPHINGSSPTGDFIDINGNQYPVMQPNVEYGLVTTPYFSQLKNNFRQTGAITLSIPIFNGWAQRTSIKQAKINIQSKQIDLEKARIKLKQDIYTAYSDAKTSAMSYRSSQKAAESSAMALDFAQKRYELGLVSTIDLLTTQNQAFKTEADAAAAKYDLIFKLKVLDYYLGRPLDLKQD